MAAIPEVPGVYSQAGRPILSSAFLRRSGSVKVVWRLVNPFLLILVVFFLLGLTVLPLAAQGRANERIFFNAKIFTAEPDAPYAEALAIRGDKILAVGSYSEVAKSVSASAERVDLQGKSLFPGFIDSHSHTADGDLPCRSTRSAL